MRVNIQCWINRKYIVLITERRFKPVKEVEGDDDEEDTIQNGLFVSIMFHSVLSHEWNLPNHDINYTYKYVLNPFLAVIVVD